MFQLIQRTGTADWKFYFCHFCNINLKMLVENLFMSNFFSAKAPNFFHDLQFAFHFHENLSQNIEESLNGVLWSEENDYNNLLLFLERVMWHKWLKCMHSWTFFLGCHFKSLIFPLIFFSFIFFAIFFNYLFVNKKNLFVNVIILQYWKYQKYWFWW